MAELDAQRLDFHRSIYDLPAIELAVSAYAGLGRFSVSASADLVQVLIEEPKSPEIADHFANHVLWATQTRRRRGAAGAP